jgi:acetyl-CoA C-acetyltransferase
VRATATAARSPIEVPPATLTVIPNALRRAELTIDEVARIELHEANAASILGVIDRLGLPPAIVNPDGGSIALGHPTGATGGRLIVSLAHALSGARRGTVGLAVVEGEDMAAATVLERRSR